MGMEMDRKVYELVRTFNVVGRRQLDAFFPGQEKAVRRAVKRLSRKGAVYINPLTGMVASNRTAYGQMDRGMLEALWVLAALREKGLAEGYFPAGKESYPVRIVAAGRGTVYDILHAGKMEEPLLWGILKRVALPECRHLAVVQDARQMEDFPVKGIFAFCMVSEKGEVVFYAGN